jgi:polysaccharide deacetylase 2 family uncharacterized protein YibQ
MKKQTVFNPRSEKSRITQTMLLLVVIAACLIFILLLLPPASAGASHAAGRNNTANMTSGAANPSPGTPTTQPAPAGGWKLAIVVDDAGYNLTKLRSLLKFPGKLTVAVLPKVLYSTRSAELIHAAGKEVLLHLPMQPEGTEDPGPGVVTIDQDQVQIRSTLQDDLATVPYAAGINNHMGSLATQDKAVMQAVFAYCEEHNLFFLDSKTTATSVIGALAPDYNLPVLARDVFLDNDRGKTQIKAALAGGMELARKKGYAVLIGHVHDELIEVLLEMYPLFIQQGFRLVTLSELLQSLKEH